MVIWLASKHASFLSLLLVPPLLSIVLLPLLNVHPRRHSPTQDGSYDLFSHTNDTRYLTRSRPSFHHPSPRRAWRTTHLLLALTSTILAILPSSQTLQIQSQTRRHTMVNHVIIVDSNLSLLVRNTRMDRTSNSFDILFFSYQKLAHVHSSFVISSQSYTVPNNCCLCRGELSFTLVPVSLRHTWASQRRIISSTNHSVGVWLVTTSL